MKNRAIAGSIILALILSGCTTPVAQTPAPPNSPQSTVALVVKTVADSDLTAVQTIIQLRNSGKLSQANTTVIENWLALVATADKQISAVLQKSEPWTQQKMEIYELLATVTAPVIATTIDPGAQAVVTQIVTLLNQIKAQVYP